MSFRSLASPRALPLWGGVALAIVAGLLSAQAGGLMDRPHRLGVAADTVPTGPEALFEYLTAGQYKSFPHESDAHASEGRHPTSVIGYLNPILDNSMRAGDAIHPPHAAAILEVFEENGSLTGWAVSVKTHTASEGKGWFWYEVRSTTDGDNPTAANWDVPGCVGCHTSGRDFVLSDYPLR